MVLLFPSFFVSCLRSFFHAEDVRLQIKAKDSVHTHASTTHKTASKAQDLGSKGSAETFIPARAIGSWRIGRSTSSQSRLAIALNLPRGHQSATKASFWTTSWADTKYVNADNIGYGKTRSEQIQA